MDPTMTNVLMEAISKRLTTFQDQFFFYNNWVFTFYDSQTLVHFLPQECIDWSYEQIRTKQRKQNHKRVSIVMNNIHKSSDVYFMFSLN